MGSIICHCSRRRECFLPSWESSKTGTQQLPADGSIIDFQRLRFFKSFE